MFSSLKFRDVFSEINANFPPALYAAGSSIGSAISMVGARKVIFHLTAGSGGAGSAQMLLYAASVSGGTGSAVLGGSGSLLTSALVGSLTSASGGVAVVEVRGEYLENNSVGPWLFPVLSVSGGSLNVAMVAHSFLRNYEPASNYDTTNYVKSETLLM
jgi:hypothetical protein